MSTSAAVKFPRDDHAADEVARAVAFVRARAVGRDEDGSLPNEEIAALRDAGLLLAPFPTPLGGGGIASGPAAIEALLPVLRELGAASLPIGRLYEGHANAVGLVWANGRIEQLARMAAEARRGALFGVWAADGAEGLRLRGVGADRVFEGSKIYCSGAGIIERPLVTARDDAGRLLMVTPKRPPSRGVDLSGWAPLGMRASATGTVDFTGVAAPDDDIIGGDDDYHRQPSFSGGAWRFLAVHLGGMEALFACLRDHLASSGRGGDPHQAARLGEAAVAVETARLWVERCAVLVEGGGAAPDAATAYVNLARHAVERAALSLLELAQRSVGLLAFLKPNPIERISRDLATYLRQPGPDRALAAGAAWTLGRAGNLDTLWS